MTWFDVLTPVMVIGLMALLFLAVVSSEGVSRHRRPRLFPADAARHRGDERALAPAVAAPDAVDGSSIATIVKGVSP